MVLLTCSLLGFSYASTGIVWVEYYFGSGDEITSFSDVHQTDDGGFVVAGAMWHYNSPEDDPLCVFRMDSEGGLLWTYGHEGWYIHGTGWIE
jgi:hypothetical protein